MHHDKISTIKFATNKPVLKTIVIDGDTFIIHRGISWYSARRYFTISKDIYGKFIKKLMYATGGPGSSTIEVIRAYERMCLDLSHNDEYLQMSHLNKKVDGEIVIPISHKIFIKHGITPIHRISITICRKTGMYYDVRYRTNKVPNTGYNKRTDISKEGLIEAIHHVINRAKQDNETDVNINDSIQEFLKKYPANEPLRYCGYADFGLTKVHGILVIKMPGSNEYKISYTLNDKHYSVVCGDTKQCVISEIIDIIGIFRVQQPAVYFNTKSMASFIKNYKDMAQIPASELGLLI